MAYNPVYMDASRPNGLGVKMPTGYLVTLTSDVAQPSTASSNFSSLHEQIKANTRALLPYLHISPITAGSLDVIVSGIAPHLYACVLSKDTVAIQVRKLVHGDVASTVDGALEQLLRKTMALLDIHVMAITPAANVKNGLGISAANDTSDAGSSWAPDRKTSPKTGLPAINEDIDEERNWGVRNPKDSTITEDDAAYFGRDRKLGGKPFGPSDAPSNKGRACAEELHFHHRLRVNACHGHHRDSFMPTPGLARDITITSHGIVSPMLPSDGARFPGCLPTYKDYTFHDATSSPIHVDAYSSQGVHGGYTSPNSTPSSPSHFRPYFFPHKATPGLDANFCFPPVCAALGEGAGNFYNFKIKYGY